MPEKEITCTVCPIGCKILVKSDGKKVDLIQGYNCKRGVEYATNEALDPKRMLASSVLVENGEWPLLSVKTSQPVPKEKIYSVLDEIKKIRVKAPIKRGTVILKNVAGTNIDIISTKTIKKNKS